MDMEELVSCSICMETFDENVRPRSLLCGHTFCTDCINNGIEGRLLSCALCKKQHQASNGSDFPINYAIEALATKFRETQLGAIPKQDQMSDSQPGGSRGVSKKMQAFIDQKDQLKSLFKISNETKKDITEYKSYIKDRRGKHTELCAKIPILQQNNEEMIFQLEKEDKRVIDFLMEGEEHLKEAKKKLRNVDALTNATHIATASEELEKVQDDLEAWNEKCKMQLPCNETIIRSQKVIRKTTKALNLYEKDEKDEVPFDFKDVLKSDLSVMKRVKDLEKSTPHLSLKSLRAKLKLAMWIWIGGPVFAVQRNGSHIRSGRISTITNGKTYLHCLRECLPPADAFTIPYDEVIEMVKKDSMISFMDLSWEGSIKGRIHILLSPQTPLATHFYKLCTAQLGPSYLHTTFIHKYNDYSVSGGDYERNDGSGGAPIFQGLDKNSDIYRRKLKEGSVGTVDYERDGPRSAQFRMYTKGPWKQSNGIFGQVKDGLNLVREAMRLDDIKKGRIEDCGIVLPFNYKEICLCVFLYMCVPVLVLALFFNR